MIAFEIVKELVLNGSPREGSTIPRLGTVGTSEKVFSQRLNLINSLLKASFGQWVEAHNLFSLELSTSSPFDIDDILQGDPQRIFKKKFLVSELYQNHGVKKITFSRLSTVVNSEYCYLFGMVYFYLGITWIKAEKDKHTRFHAVRETLAQIFQVQPILRRALDESFSEEETEKEEGESVAPEPVPKKIDPLRSRLRVFREENCLDKAAKATEALVELFGEHKTRIIVRLLFETDALDDQNVESIVKAYHETVFLLGYSKKTVTEKLFAKIVPTQPTK